MPSGGAFVRRSAARRRRVVAAAALVITLFLSVMPVPAAAQTYRFNEVTIEGNQRIEGATILSFAGIARGETVSAGQLNDAYQNILALFCPENFSRY